MSRAGWLLAAVLAVVAVAVGFALKDIGPLDAARALRIDERRVEDLRAIASGPPNRDARDPVTGEPYVRRMLPGGDFELEARFDQPRTRESLENWEQGWAHGAGRWRFHFREGAGAEPDSSGPAGP